MKKVQWFVVALVAFSSVAFAQDKMLTLDDIFSPDMIADIGLLCEHIAVQDRRCRGIISVVESDSCVKQFCECTGPFSGKARLNASDEILRRQLTVAGHFPQAFQGLFFGLLSRTGDCKNDCQEQK